MVQLSYLYMATEKTIALNIWTFVSKVMSLLFKNTIYVWHSYSSKEQASFNFVATHNVIIAYTVLIYVITI